MGLEGLFVKIRIGLGEALRSLSMVGIIVKGICNLAL